jgi:hypothetical protein
MFYLELLQLYLISNPTLSTPLSHTKYSPTHRCEVAIFTRFYHCVACFFQQIAAKETKRKEKKKLAFNFPSDVPIYTILSPRWQHE